MSDKPQITAEQAKGARLLLGQGRLHVCRELGIAPLTLDRAEIARTKEGPPPAAMLNRLRRYYEVAGVEFTAVAAEPRLIFMNHQDQFVFHYDD